MDDRKVPLQHNGQHDFLRAPASSLESTVRELQRQMANKDAVIDTLRSDLAKAEQLLITAQQQLHMQAAMLSSATGATPARLWKK